MTDFSRLLIASVALLLASCGLGWPFHPTPLHALTESPGELNSPDGYLADSVVVLQQQGIAGGLILLYRWASSQAQQANTFCLAATFVTPEGKGWRAQSSGFIADDYPRTPSLGATSRPTNMSQDE